MRKLPIILFIVLQSCASVPRESVALSQELEIMIMNSKRAHLELLDYNLRIQLERIDHFLETQYIPDFVGSFVDHSSILENLDLAASDEAKSAELQQFVQAALPVITQKRSEIANTVLEMNAALRQSIEAHYQEMLHVNQALSAHLASAATVIETREDLRQKLQESQWILPLEQMNDSIHAMLEDNGLNKNIPQ